MMELYRYFGRHWPGLDFSDEAMLNLYNHESYGGKLSANNGFACGKKWMTVQISMWKQDIQDGILRRSELEGEFPTWWLDSIFK